MSRPQSKRIYFNVWTLDGHKFEDKPQKWVVRTRFHPIESVCRALVRKLDLFPCSIQHARDIDVSRIYIVTISKWDEEVGFGKYHSKCLIEIMNDGLVNEQGRYHEHAKTKIFSS